MYEGGTGSFRYRPHTFRTTFKYDTVLFEQDIHRTFVVGVGDVGDACFPGCFPVGGKDVVSRYLLNLEFACTGQQLLETAAEFVRHGVHGDCSVWDFPHFILAHFFLDFKVTGEEFFR